LAKEGRKVLIVERNETFGGAASTFRRDGLTMEASLHELDGFDPADHKTALFDELGLTERVATVPIPELHEVRSKHLGEPFVLPSGVEAVKEAAGARFPGQRRHIGEFVDLLCDIREAINELGEQGGGGNWLASALSNPFRFWSLARNRNATTADVMDRYFGDDEALKLALVPNMSYFTDDPARLWFPGFAAAQGSYFRRRRSTQARARAEHELFHRRSGTALVPRLCGRARIVSDRRGALHQGRFGGTG
jgi:phytoene dehydrogenase-like protein